MREHTKMYILIKDSVPLGFAIIAAAHASLAAFLEYQDTPEIQEWVAGPFYKVVCKVTEEEFERSKKLDDHVTMTESALGGEEVCLAFKPREDWPKEFKYFRLYR
jgi:peptidyl-tRNA hydrolase